MSWENVSVSPRKLKKYIIESEKPEIIQTDEIPPNDFSAEAVAKSLLHVSPISVVVFIFCTNFWIKSFFLFPCDLKKKTIFNSMFNLIMAHTYKTYTTYQKTGRQFDEAFDENVPRNDLINIDIYSIFNIYSRNFVLRRKAILISDNIDHKNTIKVFFSCFQCTNTLS